MRSLPQLGLLLFAQSLVANDTPPSQEPGPVTRVEIGTESRSWDGWGTSLCWMGNVYGQRDDLADLLFTLKEVEIEGQRLPGLGMNIARYNAGASSKATFEGRTMVVSPNIPPYRQIPALWIDGRSKDPSSDSWDWTADANQRALLLKARDRGANLLELFSNSPPWWMCENDNPSGGETGTTENLRVDQRENFAHYLATIARHARDNWGVQFTTVAPFNEPSSDYWHKHCRQEGSHFSPASQSKILPLVRQAFDRAGLSDVKLAASDETWTDHGVRTWNEFSPETKALVDQVNIHGYQGRKGDRAGLHRIVQQESGKPIWNSEYGDQHADGFDMAVNLHLDFEFMKPSAWCYWQPLDGGNNGGWGLMDATLREARIGRANPKLYVFAQYSRHLRPGMRILSSNHGSTIAAVDPKSGLVVLALLNREETPMQLEIELPFQLDANASVSAWSTQPLGDDRYRRLPERKLGTGPVTVTLAPKSILTLEIRP